MKKKLVLMMSTMLVCACVLAGCGQPAGSESNNTGSTGNVESEVVADVLENSELAEERDYPYESIWFGKLEPTGELANPYPFSRFGDVDGYLPGMMPNEITAEEFSRYRVFGGGYAISDQPATYEEMIALDGSKYEIGCYYMVKDNEGNTEEECIVEYFITTMEDGSVSLEATVGENLAAGNYGVAVEGINGLYGKHFGLDPMLSGVDLMDAIIAEWGMPSYAYLSENGTTSFCEGQLVWDVGEYSVQICVYCTGENTAKVGYAFVYGENMKLQPTLRDGFINWQP